MSVPHDRRVSLRRRFGATRRRIRSHRIGLIIWRGMIIVAATLVILVGVVLLAIPGPGWLVIFAGLGILATEFEWAARLLRFVRAQVSRWTRWVVGQGRWLQLLLGAAGVVVVVAVVAAGWWIYF
jgi:uncharacterized protein (TIGR02611 family)